MNPSFPSTTPKRSEKDEKAISEIYKTLVTSFNPGKQLLLWNKKISFCQRIFLNKNSHFKIQAKKKKRLAH